MKTTISTKFENDMDLVLGFGNDYYATALYIGTDNEFDEHIYEELNLGNDPSIFFEDSNFSMAA